MSLIFFVSSYQDTNDLSRLSIFSVIHPALAAALSSEKLRISELPKNEPLTRVEYRSSPLQGTEVRDRKVLGLELYPKNVNKTAYSGQDKAEHVKRTPVNIQSAEKNFNAPLYGLQHVSRSQRKQQTGVDLQLQNGHGWDKTLDRSSQLPALGTSPSQGRLRTELTGSIAEPEKISKQASSYSSPKPSTTKSIWNSMIDRVKRTIDARKVKTSSESLRPSEVPTGKNVVDDGYTEQELTQLVDDIMRAIQMRSEEANAHREMLKSNNRWNANGGTTDGKEDGREIMVPMRRKLLVDPVVLAAVLAKSTKKLILSKNPQPQPSTKSTSDLLANVQVKLAKVLKPYVHA